MEGIHRRISGSGGHDHPAAGDDHRQRVTGLWCTSPPASSPAATPTSPRRHLLQYLYQLSRHRGGHGADGGDPLQLLSVAILSPDVVPYNYHTRPNRRPYGRRFLVVISQNDAERRIAMNHEQLATQYFLDGYNCAQAVFLPSRRRSGWSRIWPCVCPPPLAEGWESCGRCAARSAAC